MGIKRILESNDKVYVDNCGFVNLDPQSLTEEEKSKLIITPQISGEYFAKERRDSSIDDLVTSLPNKTIHQLAHESSNREQTYQVANSLFTAISLETLRKDLKNEYLYEINGLDNTTTRQENVGKLVEFTLKMASAYFGLIGLSHLDKFTPFNLISNRAKKSYQEELTKLKNNKNPEELLQGATRKRKNWIKKNLERISDEIGARSPSFDPTKPYNYSDSDLVTIAALDSQINKKNIGILTKDKEFRKHFELLSKLPKGNGATLNLYLNLNGEGIYEKRISLPSLREIDQSSRKYLENELVKDDTQFKKLLSKTTFYKGVSPPQELLYGAINTLTGIAAGAGMIASGKLMYNLYSLGILDKFSEGVYKFPFSENLDIFRATAILTTIAVASPVIGYQSFKKAYEHIKKAIEYPDVK